MTRPTLIQVGLRSVVFMGAWLALGVEAGAAEAKKPDPPTPESKGFFGSGAEGVNTTTGRVVSTAALSVEVSEQNRNVTYYAKKKDKDLVVILGQLAPPDNVTITWTQKDGRKWLEKIEGRDTVEGFVTGRTSLGLEVTPQDGAPQRALFPWAGKAQEEVAKLDQKALKRMQGAKVGDQVKLTWEISDAKRVVEMKYLAKAPAQKLPGNAAAQGNSRNHTPSAAALVRRAKRIGAASSAGGTAMPQSGGPRPGAGGGFAP